MNEMQQLVEDLRQASESTDASAPLAARALAAVTKMDAMIGRLRIEKAEADQRYHAAENTAHNVDARHTAAWKLLHRARNLLVDVEDHIPADFATVANDLVDAIEGRTTKKETPK